jgi:hypothetical protein
MADRSSTFCEIRRRIRIVGAFPDGQYLSTELPKDQHHVTRC